MTDEQINELAEKRAEAKASGDYAKADSIRCQLRNLPERVEILDLKSGKTRWYRTMLSLEERKAILDIYPV
jgi:cysteinyl-tRNA synthetase